MILSGVVLWYGLVTNLYVLTASGNRHVTKLSEYLRVSDAAGYLGVSPNTVRNWERAGKLASHRHRVNHYRLFKQVDLDDLLEDAQRSTV